LQRRRENVLSKFKEVEVLKDAKKEKEKKN
jgi:hypothetical protein